jgi:homogentisate 1,2-dioxygenase
MIEVFKTSVKTQKQANQIIKQLKANFGYEKVNFDLEDCDKILRIEAPTILVHCVMGVLKSAKFECEILPD